MEYVEILGADIPSPKRFCLRGSGYYRWWISPRCRTKRGRQCAAVNFSANMSRNMALSRTSPNPHT